MAPLAGEVRVEIEAAGLNRADVLQRRGFYPAPKGVVPDIPGLEFAGRVEQVGEGVTRWQVGDAVMGICAGGGMAQHIVADGAQLLSIPQGMKISDAAAFSGVLSHVGHDVDTLFGTWCK